MGHFKNHLHLSAMSYHRQVFIKKNKKQKVKSTWILAINRLGMLWISLEKNTFNFFDKAFRILRRFAFLNK